MEKIKLSKLKKSPNNPRYISETKFNQLKKSIEEFPEMLKLRPLVVDENNVVLGGNMRLSALQDLGIKETYVVKASELTDKQKEEFVIKDNIGYGAWDWDILANNFDGLNLGEWGLDVWQPEKEPDYSILDEDPMDTSAEDMRSNVRKAILVDFNLEDYDEAYKLVKHFRDKKEYVGGIIIEHLTNLKNNENN